MIKIDHLTDRQYMIAELLWSCTDQESLVDTIKSLPTERDRCDATGLVRIMMQDTYEQELGLEEFKDAAQAAIACAMR